MKTMYYISENENYRKYGIVILEVYDENLRTKSIWLKYIVFPFFNGNTIFNKIAFLW